ncbi:hypothetical protein F2Q68_00021355 [Brassica cretica]|uniref:Uncharacterized protein n=1 Tax=Brassica cretica TaxID=69181 RepID=A0A8S9G6R0_BRACR|nr:hypothetical protein F2Q68_00021355 [Brassica cretica]
MAEGVSMWEWSGSAFDEGEEKRFSDLSWKTNPFETETIPSHLAYEAGYSTTFAERVFGNPWIREYVISSL